MKIFDHTKLCVGNALMETVRENNPLITSGKIDMVGDDMIAGAHNTPSYACYGRLMEKAYR